MYIGLLKIAIGQSPCAFARKLFHLYPEIVLSDELESRTDKMLLSVISLPLWHGRANLKSYRNGDGIVKFLLLLVFALLVLISCGAEEEAPIEDETTSSSLPVDTLEITGYIGEEFGDSTNTFAVIVDAEFHEITGNILVLDGGESCIKEFSPSGDYIRQISRAGSGPGELSGSIYEFFQMGGDLLVLCASKQGFVVFDDSLEYKEEINNWLLNAPMLNSAVSDTTYICHKVDVDTEDTDNLIIHRRLALFEYGAEEFNQIFWEDSIQISLDDLLLNSSLIFNDLLLGLTLASNKDLIVFAVRDTEEYNVLAWDVEGTEAFSISLPMEPVAKSPEIIAEEEAYVEGFFNQRGLGEMGVYEPEPYRDMIIQVAFGPDGNIWVQRGTMEQPFFDIFDLDGTLIGHKVFPEVGWTWRFALGPNGILAWEDDPELGFQQLFMVQ